MARFREEAARMKKQGKRLYFEYDKHWTADGHSLAGDILVDHLVSDAHLGGSVAP